MLFPRIALAIWVFLIIETNVILITTRYFVKKKSVECNELKVAMDNRLDLRLSLRVYLRHTSHGSSVCENDRC
jgi:hypothetical protein